MRSGTNRSQLRRKQSSVSYESLEARHLLATLVTFNSLTGELSIDMNDDNDSAIVDVVNGNISVNGSVDIDSNLAGVQTTSADDVKQISVTGDVTKVGIRVELNGDMTTDSGRTLESISIDGINQLVINGLYDLSNRLDVGLVNSGGGITDGDDGGFRVAGETEILAGDNPIELNSGLGDFVGPVTASNSGAQDMLFVDPNDFLMDDIVASRDFQVFALGDIVDGLDASIDVQGVGRFNGASINLGNDIGDEVNFGGFRAISNGDVFLTESSAVQLNGIEANNLTVTTTNGIFDTRMSVIEVTNAAVFNGGQRIRIGENGTDVFNAGTVSFMSDGHVHIWEDSGTDLAGTNAALSVNLFSTGDLTDADDATFNVVNLTGLEAENVLLGDTETDQFNAGSIYFYTPGNFQVSEDSSMHLTETKNQAENMFLQSTGAITDAAETQVTVIQLSSFIANSVNIGNEPTDAFNSGSISFNTESQFRISENSDTVITGDNSAGNIDVTSIGSVTNDTNGGSDPGTIDVETLAIFDATSINLGNQANDTVNFGGLQFNSPGDVAVSENSDIVLSQSSSASSANLISTGSIFDAEGAVLDIAGTTTFVGDNILIGDNASDSFTTQLLTVQATGDASLTEQTGLAITGINRAASMTLQTGGNIIDTPTADTLITGNFSLSGDLLNLGNEGTDLLNFGSLTVDSAGNTNITSDGSIQLAGINQIGGILLLSASGDLTDIGLTRTEIVTRAILSGDDVILGDLVDDCFDIANGGAANLFVTASGTNDVTVDCPE